MRRFSRFWIGGRLEVWCDHPGPCRLYYCSPRLHVVWHKGWHVECWRVKGVATGIRLGRLGIVIFAGLFLKHRREAADESS